MYETKLKQVDNKKHMTQNLQSEKNNFSKKRLGEVVYQANDMFVFVVNVFLIDLGSGLNQIIDCFDWHVFLGAKHLVFNFFD